MLPTLPDRLHGDSVKLAQCLECLLDNAIKFTRVGGLALRVTGKPASDNRLALSFAVIDTGIGFTDLGEATLYQRFFQLDGSMTREYGGLGVGLAICRQLVELLGGKLTHRSEPGRGSRFQLDVEFELPAVEAAPTPQPSRDCVREPQDCTVLLVDDNSVNQLVMRGMLLKLGFRVRTADNGAAALDCLQRESFDAVLIDCQLPAQDGAALCLPDPRLARLRQSAGVHAGAERRSRAVRQRSADRLPEQAGEIRGFAVRAGAPGVVLLIG